MDNYVNTSNKEKRYNKNVDSTSHSTDTFVIEDVFCSSGFGAKMLLEHAVFKVAETEITKI